MADLDDFFAKKDKKKSKTKKFTTPEEIVKRLEDTSKKNDVKPRKKEPVAEGDEQNPIQVRPCDIDCPYLFSHARLKM
jgi:acyl-ACP thioesterase